ncbi:hypothetical protein GOBAR_AA02175 [Gossypium barbadense]|uniref:Uncharacterized protein n=1 Tax=Gossypium barbadense TaxID=3634 RepID=A0A2P5YS45_GOSBA|nr:hypothetical protein GOBAR_AA02175 [Gossypium barbadense]
MRMKFDRNVSIGDMKEKLFAELEDVEPVKNVTQLSQQYGVEDSHTEVPKSSVHGFDIDLNVGCLNQYGGGLHIPLVFIETDALGEDESDNNDCSDRKGEDFSDPDLDDVIKDIEDEGPDNENDHAPSVGNLSRGMVIRNDPEPIC